MDSPEHLNHQDMNENLIGNFDNKDFADKTKAVDATDKEAVDLGHTRYAIYFTLPSDNPIYQLASVWLGYDVHSARDVETFEKKMFQLDDADLTNAVTDPQRYGFHGTLKAPFRLHSDKNVEDLKKSLEAFSKKRVAFNCKPLKLKKLNDFFALVPARDSKRLAQLAADCVSTFDEYRAPMTEAERATRKPENLTPTQLKLLDEWGYPYVMDEFKFHMTLSNKLNDDESALVKQRLRELFRTFLGEELSVGSIALFKQENKQSRFTLVEEYELRG